MKISEIIKVNNERTQGDWKVGKVDCDEEGDWTSCVETTSSPSYVICDDEMYYPKAVSIKDMEFIAKAPYMAEMLLKIKDETGINNISTIIRKLNKLDSEIERKADIAVRYISRKMDNFTAGLSSNQIEEFKKVIKDGIECGVNETEFTKEYTQMLFDGETL